jgi:hypothetical protein
MRFVVHEVTSGLYNTDLFLVLQSRMAFPRKTETLLSEGTAKWTGRNTLWIWDLWFLCRPTSCEVCAAHVACISWSSVCSCLKRVVALTLSGRSIQVKCRFLVSLADTSCRDRRNDLSIITIAHLLQICYLASACVSCFMCGTDTDTLW